MDDDEGDRMLDQKLRSVIEAARSLGYTQIPEISIRLRPTYQIQAQAMPFGHAYLISRIQLASA